MLLHLEVGAEPCLEGLLWEGRHVALQPQLEPQQMLHRYRRAVRRRLGQPSSRGRGRGGPTPRDLGGSLSRGRKSCCRRCGRSGSRRSRRRGHSSWLPTPRAPTPRELLHLHHLHQGGLVPPGKLLQARLVLRLRLGGARCARRATRGYTWGLGSGLGYVLRLGLRVGGA